MTTAAGRPTSDPHGRLLSRTRIRLAAVMLGLVALLVVGIGAVTAVAGIRALDDDVDHALSTAADAYLARLDGELPADIGGSDETIEHAPASSDTFFLVLDPSGAVVSNPSRIPVVGLPDAAAVAAASASGRDLRTIEAGDLPVRLLTVPIDRPGRPLAGWLQAGFVLTLHDQQSASLVLTVVIVGALGLLGAALVTVVVTGRALVPIRAAFETERRFVADASHEIRTPAAIIRASAEVLDREGLVRDEGRSLVADVVAEADRLGRLVEDLLALAASERGVLRLARQPVDLRAISRETVARTSPLAAERGITLRGPDAGPALTVDGDTDRLVQVLVVLLDNASRHSPAGGIVAVTAERTGGHAEIAVSDQGPGVPADERQRIFEPFARLPGATRAGGSGSGLGLAIARRMAELHDGTLTVGNAPGGGARFVLSIPLVRGAAGPTQPAVPSSDA